MRVWHLLVIYVLVLVGLWHSGQAQAEKDINAIQWQMVEVYEAL